MKKFYSYALASTFCLALFTGCGMLLDREEELMLENEVLNKCNSIMMNMQEAKCSFMKRNSPEINFCYSSSYYDKISDEKILKEVDLLEKEYSDCKKQEEDQSYWLAF